mmetsp:Transcript_30476/g.93149  ORF Transcript_30476/g.93149 Transcript_30476/m.93149 type:complete len:89 (-) Transcript_30476:1409-1675(-)|eukprot:scaffold60412_cov32-Tisochrysis_lutea.AAC.1
MPCERTARGKFTMQSSHSMPSSHMTEQTVLCVVVTSSLAELRLRRSRALSSLVKMGTPSLYMTTKCAKTGRWSDVRNASQAAYRIART